MATAYHFNRGGTIGVGYLGVVFTSVVYGITCIQAFQYYRSPRAKTNVALIKYLAFVTFSVEMFFLIRIWELSGNIYVTTIGAIINAGRFIMNLCSHPSPVAIFLSECIRFFSLNIDLMMMEERLKPFGASGLIATADVIAYLTSPDTFYVLFFNFLIAKLDANALLTSLNSRQFIRDGSGPNMVCIHNNTNNPEAISCALTGRGDNSSEECGAAGSERGGTAQADAGTDIVCKVVVDEPYAV
ncbi:hypothetical protein V8D89_002812 [Ganoderma adspersum]